MSTVHASETKLLHQCSKCDRKFAQKYRRALHEKSHVSYDEREFVCEKCPEEKRFATKNRYKTHMKQVHENEDEMSAKQIGGKLCPECGLIFSTNASYNIHRYYWYFTKIFHYWVLKKGEFFLDQNLKFLLKLEYKLFLNFQKCWYFLY